MAKNVWKREGFSVTNGKRTFEIGDEFRYKVRGTGYKGKWRVLGVDEQNQLLIVSEENVTTLKLGDKEGYEKGEQLLNEICTKYGRGRGATGARCITDRDINKLTGYDPSKSDIFIWPKRELTRYGDEVSFVWRKYHNPEYALSDGTTGELNIPHNRFEWYDDEVGRWVIIDVPTDGTEKEVARLVTNKYLYHMLQDVHREDIPWKIIEMLCGDGGNRRYWLASRYVSTSEGNVTFGMRIVERYRLMFTPFAASLGSAYYSNSGVRPVVSIK